ncbi:MAG: MarR family EPS-associated transcriptional regulator [Deltaproteobacteria bacterium]|nr:MarR family EPS-associated transcriptional regulator [Deltaproteobacteria bacterium]
MKTQKKKTTETGETLGLLRAIDANPQMTQRDLALHLGLSLGKINFLIRALIEKGFIKADNFKNSNHKVAYLYLLTPSGIEEKARITYRFLKRKMAEYEKLEAEISQLKSEVKLLDDAAANGKKN